MECFRLHCMETKPQSHALLLVIAAYEWIERDNKPLAGEQYNNKPLDNPYNQRYDYPRYESDA